MASAAQQAQAPIAVAFSGGSIDLSKGSYFAGSVSGNTTFAFANRTADSMVFQIEITHTGGVIAWPTNIGWPGGFAPQLTSGKRHRFMFERVQSVGADWWDGSCLANY